MSGRKTWTHVQHCKFIPLLQGRKGQNRASEGTAENRSPEEEPEALGTGGQPTGEDSNYSRFSSLHHSLRERTGEGPVSSVPAATAVGWDWWKKRLSNLPLARQHLGNRLAFCY
ncbi:hypothetical protein AAFF_G00153860 [Aldrovandia affinis]|uniref:Uncharacterized protein n=1 Tax=Aldrovandia affinis TaxID=143900 RepID=A0AAD7WWP1_9TELE|nr:hypothetical protein AAFF_G00153860 [Aldrovandia affinis]